MPRSIKIGLAVFAAVVVLLIFGGMVLFSGIPEFVSALSASRKYHSRITAVSLSRESSVAGANTVFRSAPDTVRRA